MDTEKSFICHDQQVELLFAELLPDELSDARHHVEITRHLQEIHQLYLIFQYNLDCINSKYVLMSSGKVRKNNEPATSDDDYIAINAMVNNLISAGRTLVESMECYVSENYPKEDPDRKGYIKYYHDTYDNSFAYRFLVRLRDYAQHGHLPVNRSADWYGFDLHNVLNKPHYNHNRLIKQQLDRAVNEVMDVYGDLPRLSLAMTLADFTAHLLSIYHHFWTSVESAVITSEARFRELIANHPENINVIGEQEATVFIYDVDDNGFAHMVFIDDDSTRMISVFKQEAEGVANEYMNAFNELKMGTLYFRVVDKKKIEIGVL